MPNVKHRATTNIAQKNALLTLIDKIMKTYTENEVFDLLSELIADNFKEIDTTDRSVEFQLGMLKVNSKIITLKTKFI